MKKTVSLVAIALMMAGSVAYAGGCGGCGSKKAEKDKSETASVHQGENQQVACGHSKKAEKADKTA
jgi:hypothetical protein